VVTLLEGKVLVTEAMTRDADPAIGIASALQTGEQATVSSISPSTSPEHQPQRDHQTSFGE
jgi:hypothetical protein